MLRVRKSCFWINDRHRGFLALDFTPSEDPSGNSDRNNPLDTGYFFVKFSLCAAAKRVSRETPECFRRLGLFLLSPPSCFQEFCHGQARTNEYTSTGDRFLPIPLQTLYFAAPWQNVAVSLSNFPSIEGIFWNLSDGEFRNRSKLLYAC